MSENRAPAVSSEVRVASSSAYLLGVLRSVRLGLVRRAIAGRVGLILSGAAIALLVLVAVDHTWPGGAPRRLLAASGLAWMLGTALAATLAGAWVMRHRLAAAYVARALEKSHQIRHNLILNAVLVSEEPKLSYLTNAAGAQAATALLAAPTGAHLPAERGGATVLAVIAAGVAWLGYAALAPKSVGPSLGRIFGMNIAAPTATQIELIRPTADERHYAGQPLTFEFAIHGQPVENAAFELRDGSDAAAMTTVSHRLPRTAMRGERDVRSVTLAAHEVGPLVSYRIIAGDATLAGELRVRPLPAVMTTNVQLMPPAYLGLQPTTVTTSPIHAWAGTRASIAIATNTPMRSPILVYAGTTELRTRLSIDSADATRASVDVPLTDSGELTIEFADEGGKAARSTPMRVIVRGDAPPQIALVSPRAEEVSDKAIAIDELARLAAVARDDVALDEVWLATERDGVVSRERLSTASAMAGRASVEVSYGCESIELDPGKSMKVWFEARDNRHLSDGTPAGQTTASAAVTLTRDRAAAARRKGGAGGTGKVAAASTTKPTREVEIASTSTPGESNGEDGNKSGNGGTQNGTMRPAKDGEAGSVAQVTNGMDKGEEKTSPEGGSQQPNDAPSSGEGKGESDGADGGSQEAKREFERELQRFGEQHGDDAGEANRRMGGSGEQSEVTPPDQPREPGASSPPTPSNDAKDPNSPASRPAATPESQPTERMEETKQPRGEKPEAKDEPSDDEPKKGDEGKSNEQKKAEQKQDGADARKPPPSKPQESEKPQSAEQNPQSAEQNPQSQPAEQKPEDGKGGSDKGEKKPEEKAGDKPSQEKPSDGSQSTDTGKSDQPKDAPPNKPSPKGDAAQPEDAQQPGGQEPGGADAPAAGPNERVLPSEPKKEPEIPAAGEDSERPEPNAEDGNQQRSDVNDVIKLLERAGEVKESDLAALGWPAEKRAAFLRDLKRLEEAARRAGVLGDLKKWQRESRVGQAGLQHGGAGSEDAKFGVAEGRLETDTLQKLATPPEQQVSPALRGVLDAYYQALARRRAAASQPSKP